MLPSSAGPTNEPLVELFALAVVRVLLLGAIPVTRPFGDGRRAGRRRQESQPPYRSPFAYNPDAERTIIGNAGSVSAALGRLRERRVRVSVDDFGAGYSSLGHPDRLPRDTVKIGRTSVEHFGGGDAERRVWAVFTRARALGPEVLAEGVETEERCAHVGRPGRETVQGFLYTMPLEPDEVARWSASI